MSKTFAEPDAQAASIPTLRFALADHTLNPDIFTPSRAHSGDALDLRAALQDGAERAHGIIINPTRFSIRPTVVSTGLKVEIPSGYAGLVLPRSGLAVSHGVTLANSPGLIDSGYRGAIHAVLVNHGSVPLHIRHGDRIAQLLIVPAVELDVELAEALSDSERGDNGLGSTGVQ